MEKRIDSLFSMLKSQPEQTQLLLKLGIGAPLVIVLMQAAGTFVLPALVVSVIALVVILVYGGMLAVLVSRLVQSAGRWQAESAEKAARLIDNEHRRGYTGPTVVPSTGEPVSFPAQSAPAGRPEHANAHIISPSMPIAPVEPPPSPPLLADVIKAVEASQANPSRFQEVYFLLRLTDDVQRARREASRLSVLVLDVNLSGARSEEEQIEALSYDIAKVVSTLEGQISFPLQIGPTEFAFYLKNTDRQKAQTLMRPFTQALSDYWVQFGLAVYPEDGTQPEALLDAARDNIATPAPERRSRNPLNTLLRRTS